MRELAAISSYAHCNSYLLLRKPFLMGPLLFVILIAYLLIQGVENYLTYLNLKHLKEHGAEVPIAFAEAIDDKILVKMRDYTVEQSRVDMVATLVSCAATLIFLFGGVLDWYNSWVVSLRWSFVPSAVLFFLLLTYAEMALKIPFSLFTTFHIEKRYGFNTQSISLWCVDFLKGLVLSTILSVMLLSGFFWLIKTVEHYWWLVTWAFLLCFSVFMLYLSPYVIEPLFNKFTPTSNAALEERIKKMMEKAGLSISRIFTMDASKRSTHSNAYFSGIGHVKRIVLFDTLLEAGSVDEILAILAHEAGHWKKKHIFKRLAVMEIFALLGIYIAFLIVQHDGIALVFGVTTPTIYAKLLLVGFLGSLVAFPLKPLSSLYSRKHEREADDFALHLTGNPKALAQSLINLGKDNLANLHPHPWYAAIYYSHPPLVQRVNRLLSQAQQ